MRKNVFWWLVAVGLLVSLLVSGAYARMAGDFEIPAKRVVKPAARPAAGKKSFVDKFSGVRLVKIPKGCFQMGQSAAEKQQLIAERGQEMYDKFFKRELPRHRVCVDAFWLADKELTVALWRRFVDDTGYKTEAERNVGEKGSLAYKSGDGWKWREGYYWDHVGFSQTDRHPVTCVSFNDIEKFIAWLSRKSGRKFRLPTEAEWEYACRAGTTAIRFWGDDPDKACAYANAADQTKDETGSTFTYKHECRDGFAYTSPVGSFKLNSFGLYDMLGNVWEWCSDRYASDYYDESPVHNPPGPVSGARQVFRGGSWNGGPALVRAALRGGNSPAHRSGSLGFRLALSSGQE